MKLKTGMTEHDLAANQRRTAKAYQKARRAYVQKKWVLAKIRQVNAAVSSDGDRWWVQ